MQAIGAKAAAFMTSLPKLKDIQRLSDRVVRILGQNASPYTLQGTNSYVIGTGSKRILMDTTSPEAHTEDGGTAKYVENLRKFLASENARIEQVLITHRHFDHVGAMGEILRDAGVVHQPAATKCSKHKSYKHNEFTSVIDWHYLVDGEKFHSDGATLSALFMPGHTDDHVGFILEEESALFTGDHVLGHGTTFVEHLDRYIESLERLHQVNKSRQFRRFYPAHGEIIDGEAAVSRKVQEYLNHRLRRIEEIRKFVVEASPEDGVTAEQVVARFYPKLTGVLVHGAANNVQQALQFLASRGEVEMFKARSLAADETDSSRWRIKKQRV